MPKNLRPARKRVPVEPDPARLALSCSEVAFLLNVGVHHVERMVRTGELPSFYVGRRRLVARSVVETYVNEGRNLAGRVASAAS